MNYKGIYHKFAAQKYINNGFNMKKTILSMHPGIKEKTAEVRGTRLLRNVEFRNELNTILAGITDQCVNEKLNELLNAKVIISHKGRARITDLPNYSERRKTLDMLFHLTGLYPPQKIDKRSLNESYDLKLEKMSEKEIKSFIKSNLSFS